MNKHIQRALVVLKTLLFVLYSTILIASSPLPENQPTHPIVDSPIKRAVSQRRLAMDPTIKIANEINQGIEVDVVSGNLELEDSHTWIKIARAFLSIDLKKRTSQYDEKISAFAGFFINNFPEITHNDYELTQFNNALKDFEHLEKVAPLRIQISTHLKQQREQEKRDKEEAEKEENARLEKERAEHEAVIREQEEEAIRLQKQTDELLEKEAEELAAQQAAREQEIARKAQEAGLKKAAEELQRKQAQETAQKEKEEQADIDARRQSIFGTTPRRNSVSLPVSPSQAQSTIIEDPKLAERLAKLAQMELERQKQEEQDKLKAEQAKKEAARVKDEQDKQIAAEIALNRSQSRKHERRKTDVDKAMEGAQAILMSAFVAGSVSGSSRDITSGPTSAPVSPVVSKPTNRPPRQKPFVVTTPTNPSKPASPITSLPLSTPANQNLATNQPVGNSQTVAQVQQQTARSTRIINPNPVANVNTQQNVSQSLTNAAIINPALFNPNKKDSRTKMDFVKRITGYSLLGAAVYLLSKEAYLYYTEYKNAATITAP